MVAVNLIALCLVFGFDLMRSFCFTPCSPILAKSRIIDSISANIADLGELGGLDLDKRSSEGAKRRAISVSHSGRTDHQMFSGQHRPVNLQKLVGDANDYAGRWRQPAFVTDNGAMVRTISWRHDMKARFISQGEFLVGRTL